MSSNQKPQELIDRFVNLIASHSAVRIRVIDECTQKEGIREIFPFAVGQLRTGTYVVICWKFVPNAGTFFLNTHCYKLRNIVSVEPMSLPIAIGKAVPPLPQFSETYAVLQS